MEQISLKDLKKYFPDASPATLQRNSGLSGGIQNPQRKPDPLPALVKRPKVQPSGKNRLVVVVTIISLRSRVTDDDNITAGAKALRDCIAASLGVDDGDKRIKFEYGTAQTSGPEQTIVRIAAV